MSKKVDRAAHGPSWTEVILGAALSAALGVALGAAVLVAKPMTRVKAEPAPEEREKHTLYFIEGARGDANSVKQALAKRKSIGPGQTISITEQELNAIVAPVAPPAPKAGEKGAPAVVVTAPNFRIHESRLQVAMPVNVDLAGMAVGSLVVARGVIVKAGEQYTFQPDEIYLGSLPLQKFPFALDYVQEKYIRSQPLPEDIATALGNAKDLTIDGNQIKLTL